MNLTVEVLSRPRATRVFRLLAENGMLLFDGDSRTVNLYHKDSSKDISFDYSNGDVFSGYINPDAPYRDEMESFFAAVKSRDITIFPNSLADDIKVLENLNSIERKNCCIEDNFVEVVK